MESRVSAFAEHPPGVARADDALLRGVLAQHVRDEVGLLLAGEVAEGALEARGLAALVEVMRAHVVAVLVGVAALGTAVELLARVGTVELLDVLEHASLVVAAVLAKVALEGANRRRRVLGILQRPRRLVGSAPARLVARNFRPRPTGYQHVQGI